MARRLPASGSLKAPRSLDAIAWRSGHVIRGCSKLYPFTLLQKLEDIYTSEILVTFKKSCNTTNILLEL